MSRRIMESFLPRVGAKAVAYAFIALLTLQATSFAVPINHGNFDGDTVMYIDVTEDTNTGDAQPLFGEPTISGDALDFNPIGFSASATGANGVDQTDGQLFFMLQAKPGNGIQTLLLTEAGDVSLTGFGTDATFAAVTTNITLDILETDAGPANINHQTTMNFIPSDGDFGQATDGGGGPLFSSNWSGGVLIELGAILASNGRAGETATKVNVNLDNVLSALSEDGTVATIAKKDADISGLTIEVNMIPEPTTALLAVAGLLAMASSRRS